MTIAQVFALAIFFHICLAATIIEVRAHDYAAPDLDQWYKSLKQPDDATTPCCGWGDAYYADEVERCRPSDGPHCAVVAIITDTRPNEFMTSNGIKVNRPAIEVGTRIVIPKNKIRKPASANPTDHNIVFVARHSFEGDVSSTFVVYCWEPASSI